MMLEDKVAVVYGAAGAAGSAVAQAFAAEGAVVHLAGRRPGALREVAATITGRAEIAQVDALDPAAVDRDVRDVVDRHGRLDVSINLISVDHVQGVPLVDMSADDFARGLDARARTHFITATAAARPMTARGGGTILMLTASPDRTGIPMAGSFGVQCAAVESLSRALAVELGPYGVRVACLRSAGSPDADGVDQVFDVHARNAGTTREDFDAAKAGRTLLRRLPSLAEVAQVAVWLASDRAAAVTASITNVTCGELLD
ncbi:SDR family oxidoreductase [Actinoplanes sp. NPDC048791]|uniref:SDR family NAD(P)-dependent oxidoreductase n=1 Tax=Actinoplanes sp. NPDC048791 TaxID=3154623 RepID=UPI0033D69F0E